MNQDEQVAAAPTFVDRLTNYSAVSYALGFYDALKNKNALLKGGLELGETIATTGLKVTYNTVSPFVKIDERGNALLDKFDRTTDALVTTYIDTPLNAVVDLVDKYLVINDDSVDVPPVEDDYVDEVTEEEDSTEGELEYEDEGAEPVELTRLAKVKRIQSRVTGYATHQVKQRVAGPLSVVRLFTDNEYVKRVLNTPEIAKQFATKKYQTLSNHPLATQLSQTLDPILKSDNSAVTKALIVGYSTLLTTGTYVLHAGTSTVKQTALQIQQTTMDAVNNAIALVKSLGTAATTGLVQTIHAKITEMITVLQKAMKFESMKDVIAQLSLLVQSALAYVPGFSLKTS